MIRIKNCGLKTQEAIDVAAASGASFAGFVHHAPSPRHLELDAMADLVTYGRKRLATVAVLVAPDSALLNAVATHVKPDFIQLHRIPDVNYLASVRQNIPCPLIAAMAIRTAEDVTHSLPYETIATHMLLDAADAGSGLPFDWRLLQGVTFSNPWFLAGGLNEQNVAKALRTTHAPMVDVSSGIESAPGVKSPEMIAAFNKAVLDAAHA